MNSCGPWLFFQDAIFRVVAAILHLGNIDFTKGKEIDSSVPKDEKSTFHLKMTAELLMYLWITHYFGIINDTLYAGVHLFLGLIFY